MGELSGGENRRGVSLGAKAEAMLATAEEAAAAKCLDARLAAETEALESLKADLDAGIPPATLRQKLAPRIFVVDFDARRSAASFSFNEAFSLSSA